MKILVLEDNQERIVKFEKLFKYQELYMFSKVNWYLQEACLKNDFQVIMLDHDLGGKVWENSFGEGTGYQFVKWLIEAKVQKKALIYVHSMNVVGANLMVNYLRDNDYNAIWSPFHLLKIEE